MPGPTFDNDPFSRTLVRGLLLLQPTALVAVLRLSLLDRVLPALLISFLTLALLVVVIAWLYRRFRKLPIVREKRKLEHLLNKFEVKVQAEAAIVREADRERQRLFQAEKEETHAAAEEEAIKAKFQALHDRNNAVEKNAIASQQLLEHEIAALKPRLRQLVPFTFLNYLSRSLASRGLIGALLAFLLIVAQVVSSVSATGSALLASIPITGLSSSVSQAPPASQTALPALVGSSLPTPTFMPAITDTPTALPSATQTVPPSHTFTPQPSLSPSLAACIPAETGRESALVVGIVDGDTIDVRIADQVLRVRYIGIDTPERDQVFYDQATAYNQALVQNKTVTLIRDRSETDRFDRLLRYVIAGDVFVNQHLVEQGLAVASAYPPDTACARALEAAQVQAQSARLGFWLPTPEPIISLPTVTGGGSSANCHPSYLGVCIPPPPPDLDCSQISERGFIVLPPDPHRFDGDHDGIGCE